MTDAQTQVPQQQRPQIDLNTIVQIVTGSPLMVDTQYLPPSDNRFEVFSGLFIPLYGSLLGIEIALIDQINNFRGKIIKKISTLLKEVDEKYPSKSPESIRLDLLIESFYTGVYDTVVFKTVKFNPEAVSQDRVKEIAEKYSLDHFFTVDIENEGKIVLELRELIAELDESWLNVGVVGDTNLERVNNVLAGTAFEVYSNRESNLYTYPEDLVSYTEMAVFYALTNTPIVSRLLIAVRTGTMTNFFDYMTKDQADEVKKRLKVEYEVKAPVAANKNVEKVESEGSGKSVESAKSSTTKQ